MGVISLGYGPDGKRIRRKVSGKTKQEVRDKLKALHQELNARVRSSRTYTVRQTVEDWRFLTSSDPMHSQDFDPTFHGLHLPSAVVDKIYRRNAESLFPGAWKQPLQRRTDSARRPKNALTQRIANSRPKWGGLCAAQTMLFCAR